eukprot:SAG22_NODE_365_length_11632_cov_6.720281_2_plen_270_part_00
MVVASRCCGGLHYLLREPDSDRRAEHGSRGWPLILFLHGAGERGPADGSELARAADHGPIKVAEGLPGGAPGGRQPGLPDLGQFLIANPQCHPAPLSHADFLPLLKAIVDELAAEFPVDRTRIYLTGLSMGGMGTFAMLNAYPRLFAAAAPVCGGARFHVTPPPPGVDRRAYARSQPAIAAADVKPFAGTPIYIFHGQKDAVVPVRGSLDAFAALKAAGSTAVRLAIYPQQDVPEQKAHDSWTQTYEWAGLYEWFLEHTLAPELRSARL